MTNKFKHIFYICQHHPEAELCQSEIFIRKYLPIAEFNSSYITDDIPVTYVTM